MRYLARRRLSRRRGNYIILGSSRHSEDNLGVGQLIGDEGFLGLIKVCIGLPMAADFISIGIFRSTLMNVRFTC